jgi:hypothetical protein
MSICILFKDDDIQYRFKCNSMDEARGIRAELSAAGYEDIVIEISEK